MMETTLSPISFAADNHNVAAGTESFFDYAAFAAGAAAGAVAGQALIPIPVAGAALGAIAGGLIARDPVDAAKYAVGAVVSGAHSFYNTGVDIGNFMGGNLERASTELTLQSMDSSLGTYYVDNRDAVDLGGLILGSVIPGTLAAKGVNWGSRALAAAKAGKFGLNIEAATGLTPTLSEAFYAKAATQLANGTVTSRINQASIAGLAAGLGEQALMAATMELAIAATMEANPVVENMTLRDHLHNAAVGAAFFAPVFAGVGAIKGIAKATREATAADQSSMIYRYVPAIDPKISDDKALDLLYEAKKKLIPELPAEGTVDPSRLSQLSRHVVETQTKLDDLIRARWHSLTKGDVQLTNHMMALGEKSTYEEALGAIAYLKEVRRGAEITRADAGISQVLNKLAKSPTTLYHTPDGRVFADEAVAITSTPLDQVARVQSTEYLGLKVLNPGIGPKLKALADDPQAALAAGYHAIIHPITKQLKVLITPEELAGKVRELAVKAAADDSEYSKVYYHMRGALAGKISTDAPDVLRLGDQIRRGEQISIRGANVLVGKQVYAQAAVGAAFDVTAESLPQVQSRYLFAAESPKLKAGVTIHESDIPFLEKAYIEGTTNVRIVNSVGAAEVSPTGEALLDKIAAEKAAALVRTKAFTSGEVSERLNVPVDYLEGKTVSRSRAENLLMYQTELKNAPRNTNPMTDPSYAQLGYRTADFSLDGTKLDALVSSAQMQQTAEAFNRNVTANYMGEMVNDLPSLTSGDISRTSRYSGGQTFLTFGQGRYFTPEAKADLIGRVTANLMERESKLVGEYLNSVSLRIAQDQKAAIELSMIMNKARSISDSYVISSIGDMLTLKSKLKFDEATEAQIKSWTNKAQDAIAKLGGAQAEIEAAEAKLEAKIAEFKASRKYIGPVRADGTPIEVTIPISNRHTAEYLRAHTNLNYSRVTQGNQRRTALGMHKIDIQEGELYAPPPDMKRYPHFALVRDPVTGETSYIGAYTGDDLKKLGAMVPKELEVLYKENTDSYFKSLDSYRFSESIADTSVDTALKREGVMNYYFPKTDGAEIATDLITWHKEQAVKLARQMVELHYSTAVARLENLSAQYTAASTSVAKKVLNNETVDDPYTDMIKTMLNISKIGDYKTWSTINSTLDSYVSRAFSKVTQLWADSKSSANLLTINDEMARSGYRGPIYNAETVLAANHRAPQGVLSEFVRKSNALAANFMIKLDSIQAVNNAISTNTLVSSEMNYLIGEIKKLPEAAGKLKALMEISVPGIGNGATLNAPAKLIAAQYPKFFLALNGLDGSLDEFSALGIIKPIKDQMAEAFEGMAIKSSITRSEIQAQDGVFNAIKGIGDKAISKGELWTGNKHSEMMGRFVAAGVADDIAQIAISAGIISRSERLTIINSFVNKVHGATLASQRPVVFQGAVGQAISLFQSYQFNLMQQLFKYVGDGATKSAATLLGMQTAIYGVQGIPLFNTLNSHIIGMAAGNPTHRDIITSTYDIAGKENGDWLMYGLAANVLRNNMYNRGDINPRQITVLPTNLSDIPAIAISSKFVGSMYKSISDTVGGAPAAQSFLRGLEHAGINRPLSGLASIIQGYTTTDDGSLISTTRKDIKDISSINDLNLITNLGRILGAKPLDESVILDANYRYVAYRAKESTAVRDLGAVVKTAMFSGQDISQEQMDKFLAKYQAAGGKQERFAQQMINWQKDTTESVVNKVANTLGTGSSKYLQRVIAGGTGMPSYANMVTSSDLQ